MALPISVRKPGYTSGERGELSRPRQRSGLWCVCHRHESSQKSSDYKAYAILHNTSQALESLHATSGVQSFLVAVDPTHGPTNILPGAGFLGGTIVGREFWRGMRGGGEAGATAFRAYCAKAPSKTAQSVVSDGPTPGTAQGSSAPNAGALKTELYAAIRTALRFGFYRIASHTF